MSFRQDDSEPPMQRWIVRSMWSDMDGPDDTSHDTHESAYSSGRRLACVSLVTAVAIYGPQGLAHSWRRDDNQWHNFVRPPGRE